MSQFSSMFMYVFVSCLGVWYVHACLCLSVCVDCNDVVSMLEVSAGW